MFLGLHLGLGSGNTFNPLAPLNTVAPVISGTASVGQTLTVTSDGTWTNTPTSYTYQWRRAGVAITGETASTYVIVSADQGYDVTVTVTAIKSPYSGTATSNAKSIPAAGTGGQLDGSDPDQSGVMVMFN